MNNIDEIRNSAQNSTMDLVSKISSLCNELSISLKSANFSSDSIAKVDKIFKAVFEITKENTSQLNKIINENNKLQQTINFLQEEKKKLDTLYTSGILFSSSIEKRNLIETALDVVTRELKADAGFITLINEREEIDSIYSKNITPQSNPEAYEISTTVIRNTMESSKPLQIENISDTSEYALQKSILRLGISSALCVPLTSGKKVLGAVYLDRRNKDNPFTNNDLHFLISFAIQIVKGLEISSELDSLEKKIINEPTIKIEDIRKEFQSDSIIGKSKKLFEILKVASRACHSDASIFLLGESGTGKNLLAQAIHKNSKRKESPFYTVDCSSIPNDLLESELFGYESGAFTGANKTKIGKLELANGGTLFLDEIGEMNTIIQPKLLKVIQTKEFERLGGITPIKIDVRIIAATNKNISDLISQNKFREDLYYRLKVIEMRMPSLRERREDISDLVNYFLKIHTPAGKIFEINDQALEILETYQWPGNIRELENIILRCIVLTKENKITSEDLPPEIIQNISDEPLIEDGKFLSDAENEFRKMYILKVLRKTKSKTEAAKMLGVNRTHFYKLLNQLEIDY